MIKIKKATEKNLKVIQKLNLFLFKKEREKYDSTLNLQWTFGKKGVKYFKESIESKKACVLVAKEGNKIVGYLVGRIIEKNKLRKVNKQAKLDSMFVLKEFRSNGIGEMLLKRFIAWAEEKRIENLRVGFFTNNKKAEKFYKKHGFKDYAKVLEVNL